MTIEPEKTETKPAQRIARFLRARRGNVAIIVSIVMVPLIFAAGMGIDYTQATRRQDQLNGFADAAALAAVTPGMMDQSSAQAQAKAQAVFVSQMATVNNITYSPGNVVITATDVVNGTSVNRTITVSYTANSTNTFAGVLGMPSIPIAGSASAVSSVAPRINFYMLLDTSPSMQIAATQTDINTLVNNTGPQGGCAFACHEMTGGIGLGNPANLTCADGSVQFPLGGEDNLALARCLGVTLRIDLVNQATQSLMTVAQTTALTNHTDYQIAINTMDFSVNQLQPITDVVTASGLSALQTAASGIQAVEVYSQDCLGPTNCNNDTDSYLDQALVNLNTAMPPPGNGTSNAGDTPQEVLFIVSDGVNDQYFHGNRVFNPINALITNPDTCTTIKGRGIRIAFLYLTYYPLPTNPFYVSNIAPLQTPTDQYAANASACASPGLFFAVDTGGDINAAMTALFQKAVSTAHLTH